MELADFEQCILDALETIPQRIRSRMENVAFVVEATARRPHSGEKPIAGHGGELLGLYQGVPLIHRGPGYQYALPDKITIFQETIEQIAGGNDVVIRSMVHDTVLHEVAHHIGFSEEEVAVWEKKRKGRRS